MGDGSGNPAPERQREHEQELARRAAGGDRVAAEALLGLVYDQVFAICRRICANPTDGEDATQEAVIKIARALPSFDGRSAVRTWVHRIATNAALDELRRRGRRPIPVDHELDPHPGMSFDPNDGGPLLDATLVDRMAIDAALGQLAPEFRAAVVLRDLIGMEYGDIAATLDVPVGTVRSRIARGRTQLRNLLDLGNQSEVAGVEGGET